MLLIFSCCALVIIFAIGYQVIRSLLYQPLPERVESWKNRGSYYEWKHDNKIYNIFYNFNNPNNRQNDTILVFLHGYPTSSFDWFDTWENLQDYKIRMLAFDGFGFGFSDKPSSRILYQDAIEKNATILEELLQDLVKEKKEIKIVAHDYGVSVAQELLFRFISGKLNNQIDIKSICFLNGGLIPDFHKPILMQKILASKYSWIFCVLFSRPSLFMKSFSSVFGDKKPTPKELQEFWSVISYNNGRTIQGYLMQYMAERRRNKEKWVEALRSKKVNLFLVNGPADPVSGKHAAEALGKLWNCECSSYRSVNSNIVILPDEIGHYPQIEAPSLVLHFIKRFLQL